LRSGAISTSSFFPFVYDFCIASDPYIIFSFQKFALLEDIGNVITVGEALGLASQRRIELGLRDGVLCYGGYVKDNEK
jgi:hypothetical protein